MILEIIQDASDTLLVNPYFSDIQVVSINQNDVANRVDEFIASLTCGVILSTPKLSRPKANIMGATSGVYFEGIDFFATIFEDVATNRGNGGTGKMAPTIAETIAALLHGHKPDNIAESLVCVPPGIIYVPHATKLCYNVAFTTQGGVQLTPPLTQIASPSVGVVDNLNGTSTITLACSTPYAQIWYTTDGKNPSPLLPNNTPRTPYTAPFVVAQPAVIKVKAYLAGYLASPLILQNI